MGADEVGSSCLLVEATDRRMPIDAYTRAGAESAARLAREYSYDFEGVHVVKRERGWYAVYATARKDVGGASEPWPIKVLVPG